MSIQEEIHTAIKEIQKNIKAGVPLTESELEMLLLTSLIEDEG